MWDSCEGGFCKGDGVLVCDDDNVCMLDSCKVGEGCVWSFMTGVICSDGNVCTISGTCSSEGKCTNTVVVDCSDSNFCTEDSCDVAVGCENTLFSGTLCNDSDVCTLTDLCAAGTCVGGG